MHIKKRSPDAHKVLDTKPTEHYLVNKIMQTSAIVSDLSQAAKCRVLHRVGCSMHREVLSMPYCRRLGIGRAGLSAEAPNLITIIIRDEVDCLAVAPWKNIRGLGCL